MRWWFHDKRTLFSDNRRAESSLHSTLAACTSLNIRVSCQLSLLFAYLHQCYINFTVLLLVYLSQCSQRFLTRHSESFFALCDCTWRLAIISRRQCCNFSNQYHDAHLCDRYASGVRALFAQQRIVLQNPNFCQLSPCTARTDETHIKPIGSLPDMHHVPAERVVEYVTPFVRNGLRAVLLFGVLLRDDVEKDAQGSCALSPLNPVCIAIGLLKKRLPSLLVAADVCLCGYTDHGRTLIVFLSHKFITSMSFHQIAVYSKTAESMRSSRRKQLPMWRCTTQWPAQTLWRRLT